MIQKLVEARDEIQELKVYIVELKVLKKPEVNNNRAYFTMAESKELIC